MKKNTKNSATECREHEFRGATVIRTQGNILVLKTILGDVVEVEMVEREEGRLNEREEKDN